MKILLDESVDVNFRHRLMGHDVFTVAYMGWKGLSNGALITRAAADGFHAIVTTDLAMSSQQNRAALPLALVVLRARSNDIADLDTLVPNLLKELNHSVPGSVIEVRP